MVGRVHTCRGHQIRARTTDDRREVVLLLDPIGLHPVKARSPTLHTECIPQPPHHHTAALCDAQGDQVQEGGAQRL